MAACLERPTSGIHCNRNGDGQRSISSAFELDVAGLVQGTGQWENMQEVVRSAIKTLFDTQAKHQRQLHQVQALVVSSSKKLAIEKASRQDLARAVAGCADNASALSKLGVEISTVREGCSAETSDLRARSETKVSKTHLTACLENKVNHSELVELRGRLGRVCAETGSMEMRVKQALKDKAHELEKRLEALEMSVRGCEAHAVRADPTAVALRIETLASELRNLCKRMDRKADAFATERALQEKIDKQTLDAALAPKAERTDLSSIEASAASLLALSRERAAAATSVERDLRAASGEAAAFRQRADDHDKIIARLETEVVEQKQVYRVMLDKRARGLEKRVARAEEGMGAMASEIGIRVTEATRRLRESGKAERKSVTEALQALAKRVEECDPSRQAAAVRTALETKVAAFERVATEAANAAKTRESADLRLTSLERKCCEQETRVAALASLVKVSAGQMTIPDVTEQHASVRDGDTPPQTTQVGKRIAAEARATVGGGNELKRVESSRHDVRAGITSDRFGAPRRGENDGRSGLDHVRPCGQRRRRGAGGKGDEGFGVGSSQAEGRETRIRRDSSRHTDEDPARLYGNEDQSFLSPSCPTGGEDTPHGTLESTARREYGAASHDTGAPATIAASTARTSGWIAEGKAGARNRQLSREVKADALLSPSSPARDSNARLPHGGEQRRGRGTVGPPRRSRIDDSNSRNQAGGEGAEVRRSFSSVSGRSCSSRGSRPGSSAFGPSPSSARARSAVSAVIVDDERYRDDGNSNGNDHERRWRSMRSTCEKRHASAGGARAAVTERRGDVLRSDAEDNYAEMFPPPKTRRGSTRWGGSRNDNYPCGLVEGENQHRCGADTCSCRRSTAFLSGCRRSGRGERVDVDGDDNHDHDSDDRDPGGNAVARRLEQLRKEKELFRAMIARGD